MNVVRAFNGAGASPVNPDHLPPLVARPRVATLAQLTRSGSGGVVSFGSMPSPALREQLQVDREIGMDELSRDITQPEVVRRLTQALHHHDQNHKNKSRQRSDEDLMAAATNIATSATRAQRKLKDHCDCHLQLRQITDAYVKFHTMTQRQQSSFILESVIAQSDSGRAKRWDSPVAGSSLCVDCWRYLHGHIKRSRFHAIQAKAKDGERRVVPRLGDTQARLGVSDATLEAKAWILEFAKWVGDHMPDAHVTALPVKTRSELYTVYKQEWEETTKEGIDREFSKCVNLRLFLKIFKQMSPQLAVQKTKRFAQCADCHSLQSSIAQHKSEAIVAKYSALLKTHRTHIAIIRLKYKCHREKARSLREKGKCLSIIMDGMDQAKTRLPHLHREPKGLDELEQLKMHVTGVIIHGLMHGICTWVDNFPKDPNMVATVFMDSLAELRRIYGPEWQMPRKCYIQLDNCSGENKNKYFVTFCAALVHLGLFDKIKISFLPVGHTHEDIDQMFSRLAVLWKNCSYYSLPQMVDIARRFKSKHMTAVDAERQQAEVDLSRGPVEAPAPSNPVAHHYPALNIRHLRECADVKHWMRDTITAKAWQGISLFNCMVLYKQVNPNTGKASVKLKVRFCMCSEDEVACEWHGRNHWQPREPDGKEADGIELFTEDSKVVLDPEAIPLVPMKPLPLAEKDILAYFSKIPTVAKVGRRRHNQEPEVADEVPAGDPRIADGLKWFKHFFTEQDEIMAGMCPTCKVLRVKSEKLRADVRSLASSKVMMDTLTKYVRGLAPDDVIQRDHRHTSSDESEASEDEESDSDGGGKELSTAERLTASRRQMNDAARALHEHLLNPSAADAAKHSFFDTHRIFQTDEFGRLPLAGGPGPDQMNPPDEVKNEPAPNLHSEWLWEDEDVSLLVIGSKRKRRKPHPRGLLVGDLVIAMIQVNGGGPNTIGCGRVTGRCPANLDHVMVHWHGNASDNINGTMEPGFIDKEHDLDYRRKARATDEGPYEDSVWGGCLVTWSCDWELSKAKKLPARNCKDRVQLTPAVAHIFAKLAKPSKAVGKSKS